MSFFLCLSLTYDLCYPGANVKTNITANYTERVNSSPRNSEVFAPRLVTGFSGWSRLPSGHWRTAGCQGPAVLGSGSVEHRTQLGEWPHGISAPVVFARSNGSGVLSTVRWMTPWCPHGVSVPAVGTADGAVNSALVEGPHGDCAPVSSAGINCSVSLRSADSFAMGISHLQCQKLVQLFKTFFLENCTKQISVPSSCLKRLTADIGW